MIKICQKNLHEYEGKRCWECVKIRMRLNRKKPKDKVKTKLDTRKWMLKKNYGITLDQYNQMLICQNYRCALCKSLKSVTEGKNLSVDHCHKTGRIRGLLCSDCNVGLGMFKDSILRLERAAVYLNKSYAGAPIVPMKIKEVE